MAPLQRSWQTVGLTEESRANDVRPYGEVVYLFEKGGAMWASPPTVGVRVCGECGENIAYRKTEIPRRGEQAAVAAVREIVFLR